MTLLATKNLSSQETFETTPWSLPDSMPAEIAASKEVRIKWQAKPTTNHVFYSGFEGLNPHIRIGQSNPPLFLRALVADFDSPFDGDAKERIERLLTPDLYPTWASTTRSKGVRLVWLLEKRVAMDSAVLLKAFLTRTSKTLKLAKLFAGIDAEAWTSANKLYELGEKWVQTGSEIPPHTVEAWIYDAVSTIKGADWTNGPEIPLADVHAEVERKFPGRWGHGAFDVGSRGCVVFDPNATNPTSAIVTEKGLVTFSQEKSFYSWAEVLGPGFVEQYCRDRVGKAVEGVYYADKLFWSLDDKKIWRSSTTEALRRDLTIRSNLNPDAAKTEKASEVERALHYIEQFHRADGLKPLLFVQDLVVWENKKCFLNTARCVAMEPAPGEPGPWGEGFGRMARFMDTFPKDARATTWLLAWWKCFWESARKGSLRKGHALFLAGGVDIGKSFFGARMVAPTVGWSYPASNYLRGDVTWNKELFEAPLLTVDDMDMSTSDAESSKFAAQVKQLVVNPLYEYRAKFRDETGIEWSGRVIVTMNDDVVSLRALPVMDVGIRDKLGVIQVKKPDTEWGTWDENEAWVMEELPSFLRWLQHWVIPAEIKGGRLGIREFIDPSLEQQGLASKGTTSLLDIFDLYARIVVRDKLGGGFPYVGKASDLLHMLHEIESIRTIVKETPMSLGRKLSSLSETGRRVRVQSRSNHSVTWEILAAVDGVA